MKNFVAIACLGATLAACGSKSAAPTGQVAATVGGQEITTSELKMELGGLADSPQAAQAQPLALNAIVNRKLLAQAAVARGIDKTPFGAVALQKARELALIGLLQQSIAAGAPKPSADEIRIFVNDNPQAFANRRILMVDQWNAPRVTPQVLAAMGPINTIEPILKLLDDNKLKYEQGVGTIDLLTVPTEPGQKLAAMKVGDVFVTPTGQGAQISRIREVVDQPLNDADATRAATAVLTQQRAGGLVQKQIQEIEKAGQGNVKLNSAFKLPPQPKNTGE